MSKGPVGITYRTDLGTVIGQLHNGNEGLQDLEVELSDAGKQVSTHRTDSQGFYKFDGVPAGASIGRRPTSERLPGRGSRTWSARCPPVRSNHERLGYLQIARGWHV